MKKVIITGGGTSEKIDSVRAISNLSTGRLASLTALKLSAAKEYEIEYLCSKNALKPEGDHIKISICDDTQAVYDRLEELCKENDIYGIVHAMAISDYRVKYACNLEDLNGVTSLEERMGAVALDRRDKLSSDIEKLVLMLEKTPKIISYLRKWAPKAKIIGFKLLHDVSKEELISVGYKLLEKNKCDFVFANDSVNIYGDKHLAYCIDAQKNYQQLNTKQQIAEKISLLLKED